MIGLGSDKSNLYPVTLLGPEHLARYSITSSSSPLVLLCKINNSMHGFRSSSSCSSSMAKISETKQIFGVCSQIRNLLHILQRTNGIMLIISCRQSSRPLSVPFSNSQEVSQPSRLSLGPSYQPWDWIQTIFAARGIPCKKTFCEIQSSSLLLLLKVFKCLRWICKKQITTSQVMVLQTRRHRTWESPLERVSYWIFNRFRNTSCLSQTCRDFHIFDTMHFHRLARVFCRNLPSEAFPLYILSHR